MAATRAGPHSDGEQASRNKKPKLEAVHHSDCDTDSDLEEDMERVTNLLTAGGGSPGNTPSLVLLLTVFVKFISFGKWWQLESSLVPRI